MTCEALQNYCKEHNIDIRSEIAQRKCNRELRLAQEKIKKKGMESQSLTQTK